MSKFKKALVRLKSRPTDFTWSELQTIMRHFGYQEKKGSGSVRKFIHPQTKVVVNLHEPHPKPQIKLYALDIIIDHLKEEGLL
jgi:predicted RNA binding protein YcfA (HicA-like mRNA interferase family)